MWFDVSRMPLGKAMWSLIVLAIVGLLAVTAVSGWLLFFYIAQHVRFI